MPIQTEAENERMLSIVQKLMEKGEQLSLEDCICRPNTRN
jgi:hypothetical protein